MILNYHASSVILVHNDEKSAAITSLFLLPKAILKAKEIIDNPKIKKTRLSFFPCGKIDGANNKALANVTNKLLKIEEIFCNFDIRNNRLVAVYLD